MEEQRQSWYLFASILVLLLQASICAAQNPMVLTDKSDYMPGDTVAVSSSGWLANETVMLVFYHARITFQRERESISIR